MRVIGAVGKSGRHLWPLVDMSGGNGGQVMLVAGREKVHFHGMPDRINTVIIQLYPLPFVYTVRSDLLRASADLRIRSNRTNPVPQHGEKSTTGRIYKDLVEKKIQYLIDLALNVITLTCLPPRLYAITPHHPPQSRPYEPSGQWPQHQSLPSASAAPPGPVPGH